MAKPKKLSSATEQALTRLLTNQPVAAGGNPPFPGSSTKTASQEHEEFIVALLSADPTVIAPALSTKPSSDKITDLAEIAKITQIVVSFFDETGQNTTIGKRTYNRIKDLLADCGDDDDPDPTFY